MANPLDPIYVPMVRNSARSTGTNSPSSYGNDMRSIATEFQDMLTAQADKNNAWSAEQAQKQMDFQRAAQQRSMDFNSKEAAKNRNWQKMMSDTAHQREVRDLMAAGLNPILAVNGGNGAPVGSGATASSTGSQSGAKGDTDTSSRRNGQWKGSLPGGTLWRSARRELLECGPSGWWARWEGTPGKLPCTLRPKCALRAR